MNRAHQPRAVGFAGMISDEDVKSKQYYYTPVMPSEEKLKCLEAAWKILLDWKHKGLTVGELAEKLTDVGYKINTTNNGFIDTLENYGYICSESWCDPVRYYPFKNPAGIIIEYPDEITHEPIATPAKLPV